MPPVFVPSKSRLGLKTNKAMEQAIAALSSLHDEKKVKDGDWLVVLVIEAADLALYRQRWPCFTYAILPRSNRGISYSRFIMHRALCHQTFGEPSRLLIKTTVSNRIFQ